MARLEAATPSDWLWEISRWGTRHEVIGLLGDLSPGSTRGLVRLVACLERLPSVADPETRESSLRRLTHANEYRPIHFEIETASVLVAMGHRVRFWPVEKTKICRGPDLVVTRGGTDTHIEVATLREPGLSKASRELLALFSYTGDFDVRVACKVHTEAYIADDREIEVLKYETDSAVQIAKRDQLFQAVFRPGMLEFLVAPDGVDDTEFRSQAERLGIVAALLGPEFVWNEETRLIRKINKKIRDHQWPQQSPVVLVLFANLFPMFRPWRDYWVDLGLETSARLAGKPEVAGVVVVFEVGGVGGTNESYQRDSFDVASVYEQGGALWTVLNVRNESCPWPDATQVSERLATRFRLVA